MRLTVGPLPPAVYWRRRAAVAAALALVGLLVAVLVSGPGGSAPTTNPTLTGGPQLSDRSRSAPGSPTTPTSGSPGTSSSSADPGSSSPGTGAGGGGGGNGGGGGPVVVATVACTDAEMSLAVVVSPSPGRYGGIITLTLLVRNTATHACYRDVGSSQQELQVRQGGTVVWSSDHCNPPQTTDVRAFGPNIETTFWRTWNTYKVAPNDCDPPAGGAPAAVGPYQVVARLGTKVSEPVDFEIQP